MGTDNPSQAALNKMLDQVTRVTVAHPTPHRFTRRLVERVVYKTKSPDDIAALKDTLRIIEAPSTFGHCMCIGDPWLSFYKGRHKIAQLSCHHGRSIRWAAEWKWDAVLQDGMQLVNWLAERGVTSLREEVEAMQQRAEIARQQAERWLNAMPACLNRFAQQMMHGERGIGMAIFVPKSVGTKPGQTPARRTVSREIAPLLDELERSYEDQPTLVLALFYWFGHSAGPWSGFPAYEGIPEEVLASYPTEVLISALAGAELSPEHLEGAARFFSGLLFHRYEPDGARLLPPELRLRLLDHVLQSGTEDNKNRAQRALGPAQ